MAHWSSITWRSRYLLHRSRGRSSLASPAVITMISSSLDDTNDPYHLHHYDNPGQVFVSHPLNGDNYPTWRRFMSMALMAKNKLGFVNGKIKKLDEASASYFAWLRCNTMVCSWLFNAMTKELFDSFVYCDSTAQIWSELHDRFSQSNSPRIYEIQRHIVNH